MACILEIRTSVSCCPKRSAERPGDRGSGGGFLTRILRTADRHYQRAEDKAGRSKTLTVADTGRIGAFLDWGLPKDLLLPFKEQTGKVAKGDQVLVSLYIDKSGRLCATMKVYEMLRTDAPYQKDDQVEGIVYETSERFGVFVAVDDCYSALIPRREAFGDLKVGTESRQSAPGQGGRQAGLERAGKGLSSDGRGCEADL